MIVISKVDRKRLIKGVKYEVQSLYNAPSASPTNAYPRRNSKGSLYIKGIGRFSVDGFTDESGNPLPAINLNTQANAYSSKRTEFKDLKVGDILICRSDKYTTLVKGNKYRIDDLSDRSVPRISSSGRTLTPYQKQRVRFEGSSRYYDFSSWRFSQLPKDEYREMQLSSVFGESYKASVSKTRKFEQIENQTEVLISMLAKSMIDPYRHHLGIVDWACQKTGKDLKINKDDYKSLLKMKLSDIIKLIETK
jgi:hypothetical protein